MGRLASRFLAVLLAVRVIPTLPGLVSVFLLTPAVHVPGGVVTGALANTVLPLVLAALCWWGAPAVAARLLAPGTGPGLLPVPGLQVTLFRAVGLYLALSAASGVVFWALTLLMRSAPGFVLPLFIGALVELALGLAAFRWAPELARRFSGRRR